MKYHRYTDEHKAWIKEHRDQGSPGKITSMFNSKFGTSVTVRAMRQRIYNSYKEEVPAPKKKAKIHSICWDCRKANASADCEWANRLAPVEGWKIKKSRNADDDEVVKVVSCPKFIADEKGENRMEGEAVDNKRMAFKSH